MSLTAEQLNRVIERTHADVLPIDVWDDSGAAYTVASLAREIMELRARLENVGNLPIHYGSLWIGTTYNCGADASEWVSRDSLIAAIAEESRRG